jgi:hypothetical protein
MKSCDLSYHFLEIWSLTFISGKRAAHSVADRNEGVGGSGGLESAKIRHVWCRRCGFFARSESPNYKLHSQKEGRTTAAAVGFALD